MEASATAGHDRSRYEGKNLLKLLFVLFGPAFVLFLKFAFSVSDRGPGITAEQAVWMHRMSTVILAVFILLEIVSARYVQRLLRPAPTRVRDAAQYLAVLALCLFSCYCGAVICEAFGYEVLLRIAQPR